MRTLVALVVAAIPFVAHADVTAPPAAAAARADRVRVVEPRDCEYLKASFRPSLQQVQRAEKLLPAALRALAARQTYAGGGARAVLQHFATDFRYYVGRPGGVIAVRANSPLPDESAGKLRLCPPAIADGGDMVWHIVFDPKTGTFSGFGTNGEA